LIRKILFAGMLIPYMLFGFDPYLCATYMGDSVFSAKPHSTCVIDNDLKRWIKCRRYFKKNMLNGLTHDGKREVAVDPTFYYRYFDGKIKNILQEEVKKQVEKAHGILCMENTEASLLRYQESIAEHEWCYAPRFIKTFEDDLMNELEMKYGYFLKLYNIRSEMLEAKEKPKDKSVLCGVYLECMHSFIQADHTEVTSGLFDLYEQTRKECVSDYFVLEVSINVKMNKNIVMHKYKPGTRDVTRKGSFSAKRIFHIDPVRNSIEVRKLENDMSQQNTKNISQGHFLGDRSYNVDVKQRKQRPAPRIIITASVTGKKDKKIMITAKPVKYPTQYDFEIDLETLRQKGDYSGTTTAKHGIHTFALPKSLMQHIGMNVRTGTSGSCTISIHSADRAEVEMFKLYDRQ